LIGTCDSYSILWDNFVTLFDRYWKVECEKVFISENKVKKYEGYHFHTPGKNAWSNRMLSAMRQVKTEYTFFILEDYYFTELIDDKEVDFHLDFMQEYKANKVMMEYKCPNLSLIDESIYQKRTFFKLHDRSNYLTSVQPSIWKTSHLIECMQKDWSPWDFEISGTKRIKGRENKTYLMLRDKKPYWNAVRKGLKISPGWPEIRKKEKLKEIKL
jgi:hypothetical protein